MSNESPFANRTVTVSSEGSKFKTVPLVAATIEIRNAFPRTWAEKMDRLLNGETVGWKNKRYKLDPTS